MRRHAALQTAGCWGPGAHLVFHVTATFQRQLRQPCDTCVQCRASSHMHYHAILILCRSKRWEALTVDVSQGSSHELLGGQPSSGIAPLGSAMSLSASAASLGKDPGKGPPGGSSRHWH